MNFFAKAFVIGTLATASLFTAVGASHAGGEIKRVIKDQNTGEVLFNCGSIYRHRQAGLFQPGTVLVNQAPVVATAPMHKYSYRMQQFIKACNANHTLYAGHTQPMFSIGIGIGVTKHVGGGDTNVYGSQAISGSNSGASAGATAGSSSGR